MNTYTILPKIRQWKKWKSDYISLSYDRKSFSLRTVYTVFRKNDTPKHLVEKCKYVLNYNNPLLHLKDFYFTKCQIIYLLYTHGAYERRPCDDKRINNMSKEDRNLTKFAELKRGYGAKKTVDTIQSVTTSSRRHLRSSETRTTSNEWRERSSVNAASAIPGQQHGTHFHLIFGL